MELAGIRRSGAKHLLQHDTNAGERSFFLYIQEVLIGMAKRV